MSSGTSQVTVRCPCGGSGTATVQWEYIPESGPSYSSGGEPAEFSWEVDGLVECDECTEVIDDAEEQINSITSSEIMQQDERADAYEEED